MIGSCKVELDAGRFLDGFVVVELRAIVRGDGLDLIRHPPEQHLRSLASAEHAAVGQFADQRIARLSFHERGDAVRRVFSYHGVNLPVANGTALVDTRRPLGDVTLPGQAASAVVAVVALASKFGRASKVAV